MSSTSSVGANTPATVSSSVAASSSAAASSSSAVPSPPFSEITKGASLLIAYRLENRAVLLIGGGAVAAGRLYFLLEAGAHVTLVAPRPNLDPAIAYRIDTSNSSDITYLDRHFLGASDPLAPTISDYAMVLTAIDDNPTSYAVYELCRAARVPVNVADVPPKCDFYFGAQLRRGPLQLMVSTGGMGPKIGAMVRDLASEALPPNLEEAISGVGALRADLRKRAPGVGGELGKKRMQWMIGVCDTWGLGQMAALNDEAIRGKVLDRGWDEGRIVGPSEAGVPDTKGAASGSGSGSGWAGRLHGLLPGSLLNADQVPAAVAGLASGVALGIAGTLYYLRHAR